MLYKDGGLNEKKEKNCTTWWWPLLRPKHVVASFSPLVLLIYVQLCFDYPYILYWNTQRGRRNSNLNIFLLPSIVTFQLLVLKTISTVVFSASLKMSMPLYPLLIHLLFHNHSSFREWTTRILRNHVYLTTCQLLTIRSQSHMPLT